MAREKPSIKLKLEGKRAQRGIALTDFANFIESFVRGLRDFERTRRNAPTRKAGHPEKSAAAAGAFQLVRLKPGSAIAELQPDVAASDEESLPLEGDIPFPVQNLAALIDELEQRTLPPDVGGAFRDACRAPGA